MLLTFEALLHAWRTNFAGFSILNNIIFTFLVIGISIGGGCVVGFALGWVQGVAHGFSLFRNMHKPVKHHSTDP